MVDFKNERRVEFRDRSGKFKQSFVRTIFIKDIDKTKQKVSVWRSPFQVAIEFEIGWVYLFKKLQTDKHPEDGPPFQLKTSYNSSIRKCSQATVDLFKDVDIIDGTYQGKYFKTEKQIKALKTNWLTHRQIRASETISNLSMCQPSSFLCFFK